MQRSGMEKESSIFVPFRGHAKSRTLPSARPAFLPLDPGAAPGLKVSSCNVDFIAVLFRH